MERFKKRIILDAYDIELHPLSSDGIENTERIRDEEEDEEVTVENTLEAELTSLKTENRRLNSEVADLQHERDELKTSNCGFTEQTKKEIDNLKTEKEIVDLNKEKLRLNYEVTILKAELDILKKKVEENS